MFGASDTQPFQAKEWQVGLNYRYLRANDHYNGIQFQETRKEIGNYVINKQQAYDLSATYTITERWSASFSVPYVEASWGIPLPAQRPLGPRSTQDGRGVGDIILSSHYWMFDPAKHPRGNLSLGLGVKAPTGNDDVHDTYPVFNGTNPTSKAIDQSVQPGDGGWGAVVDIQGYKSWKSVTWYASGTYLINPRDTNNTDSLITGLGFKANPPDLAKDSVPDQYMARTGTIFPFHGGMFAATAGFRIEGLPRYDLIGDSHGFRRPGYQTSFEPGFIYSAGRSTYSVYTPIHLVQNRLANPYTGNAGDATFPKYIVLAGYSYRFAPPGGANRRTPELPGPKSPRPTPEPPQTPSGSPGGGAAGLASVAPAAGAAGTAGAAADDGVCIVP